MCGVAGFIDFNKHTTETVLRSMTDVLHHRGPDDSGYYFDRNEKNSIGFGHRRLSILDLSVKGHQPMEFQNIIITYNGEIYNFKEIREKLEQKGYGFNSNTDTEVILKAYHCWGTEMVHHFNGMFAFALYDKHTQKVVLFRDRAGVKPLYWYFRDNLFLFASELKSFHHHPQFKKDLNYDGLALFLQYGYIAQPHTIFNNCYKLRGGYYLTVDLEKKTVQEIKYWDVSDFYLKQRIKIAEQDAIDETERILKSAFEYRMIADVPVGVFLSGGYDSSVVAAILQMNRTERIKTFTIGFTEKKYNEAIYAKKIAEYLGTDHTEYYCSPQDAINIIPLLPEIWDEPFGDSSAIPTVLVSRLARKQVTVSLSADGDDEIFGGYDKYIKIFKLKEFLNKIPRFSYNIIHNIPKNPLLRYIIRNNDKIWRNCNRLAEIVGTSENYLLSNISSTFLSHELKEILNNPFNSISTCFDESINGNWLHKILAVDYKTYQIDDILTKVDRATMSVSLEGREPLLDHRIIEYVAQLEPDLKIRNGTKKYLLKQIAYKYIPKELLDRPKMGFAVPINEWLRDDIKELVLSYLNEQKLKHDGIFNIKSVIKIRDDYFNRKIYVPRVWFLLMFQMWKEKWIDCHTVSTL